jgi:hypothetical protein
VARVLEVTDGKGAYAALDPIAGDFTGTVNQKKADLRPRIPRTDCCAASHTPVMRDRHCSCRAAAGPSCRAHVWMPTLAAPALQLTACPGAAPGKQKVSAAHAGHRQQTPGLTASEALQPVSVQYLDSAGTVCKVVEHAA